MQKKKGISLIVLVITIIVMVILAGAIVLTLNNSGVIDRASEAVDKTNEVQVKELAELAWAEAYMNGAKTDEEFQEAVEAILEKNKIDVSEYGIVATKDGVKIAKGWLQDGLTVRKGEQVLNIGDEIEYTATGTDYADGWAILGANDNGELLILSNGYVVSNHRLGDETGGENLNESVNDWLNGATELDGLCAPYGKGKSATGARSIRVEDVDKITGYNPEKYGVGLGGPYVDRFGEYGNIVTISYAGEGKLKWYSDNIKKEGVSAAENNFYYIDEKNNFMEADLINGTGELTKLKSNYYEYSPLDVEEFDYESTAYKMLFGEYMSESGSYWLASKTILTVDRYCSRLWF